MTTSLRHAFVTGPTGLVTGKLSLEVEPIILTQRTRQSKIYGTS